MFGSFQKKTRRFHASLPVLLLTALLLWGCHDTDSPDETAENTAADPVPQAVSPETDVPETDETEDIEEAEIPEEEAFLASFYLDFSQSTEPYPFVCRRTSSPPMWKVSQPY